jgi:Putative rhamnosyl transferase/Glycosyl transferases group 1
MSAMPRRRIAVYGELDSNLVDGSSVWLQSVCQVLASLDGVEVTLLLRRPLDPGRRFLLAGLEADGGVELVDAGRPGLLAPVEALDLLEELDRERGRFDLVLLRGQALLAEAAGGEGFDGRLWSYAMTGRGMPDATLRALAARSARLLCQTEAVAAELREIAPEANGSVLVLPPMIPDFAPPPGRNGGEGPLRLVYSGKLAPEYCWLETVAAFRRLREAQPGAELHVLGDKIYRPPEHPDFHEEATRALRETEGLRWHGAVPRAAVHDLLAGCDLALSIRDPGVESAREISTKVLEYGAAGLPVVLNRAPAYERLLGERYPLFVDGPADAGRVLAGPGMDPGIRAVAAEACSTASREFTFSRVASRLVGHLPPAVASAPHPTLTPREWGQSRMRSSNGAGADVSAVPPLLITTPFGVGIKDRAWLNHRLVLIASITAPSLLAQSDQNFRWILFADPDLPPEVRIDLEKILDPFDGRAFIHSEGGYNTPSVLSLAQEIGTVGADEYMFTGRVDDDDAWSTHTVDMARSRAASWIQSRSDAPGVGFTYENGLEWIMYDMVDIDVWRNTGRMVRREATIRPYTYPFLGTSVFVLSRLRSGICAISAGHGNMGKLLERKGYDVDAVSTEWPMWLYCRHKQADSSLQKADGSDRDVALADLILEFGLDKEQTTRYLANAEAHGYGLVKRIKRFRPGLERELEEVCRQIGDPMTDEARCAELEQRKARLVNEIAEMSEGVVGSLEKASASNSGDELLT